MFEVKKEGFKEGQGLMAVTGHCEKRIAVEIFV
jgi:hypothetical protein